MGMWIDYMKSGNASWYVKLPYTAVYWVIWMPVKVVFYHFLWQLILVNLFYLVVAAGKSAKNGFIGFLGIFGEYFGSSYSDYCMEAKWDEESEK
jgi:hypothetical protein